MRPSRINDDAGKLQGIPALIEFEIDQLPGGQDVLLRVAGEIDVATAPLLRIAARDALAERPGQVHLHLGQVTFLDCAGLGVLIGLRNRAVLARSVIASGPVWRLIELAGMSHLFDLHHPTPSVAPGTATSASRIWADKATAVGRCAVRA